MKYLFLLMLAIGIRMSRSKSFSGSKVLLFSLDGFRWDYIEKWPTPNFDKLEQRGCRATYINNTFVTKTFPSHYTIATGMYEESHGIIANNMYDPEFKEIFNIRTTDPKWWNGGEPIWVTAKRNGLKSATFFWPGSDVEIRNYRPDYWKSYNSSITFETQVDQVMSWLQNDIDVVVMYYHEPDSTGHTYGPFANETKEKVIEVDQKLGYLIEKFENNGLWNEVNLLLVSDHGMSEVDSQNKTINISHYLSVQNDIQLYLSYGPFMQITPVKNRTQIVYDALKDVSNMDVYLKENIPQFWNYRNNRRVMPILAVANDGWSIIHNKTVRDKGNHGYDNRLMSMKPIFYATGPNIRPTCKIQSFNTVDIYLLMCRLLSISPAPNNGSEVNIEQLFLEQSNARSIAASRTGRLVVDLLILTFSLVISFIYDT